MRAAALPLLLGCAARLDLAGSSGLAFAPPVRVGRLAHGGDADSFYALPPAGETGPSPGGAVGPENAAGAPQLLFGVDGGAVFSSADLGTTWRSDNATASLGGADSMLFLPGKRSWRAWGPGLSAHSDDTNGSWTNFSATTTVLWGASGGALTARAAAASVTFSGLPHAVSCGFIPKLRSLGGFGCPFELSPTAHATLPGSGDIIQTALVYWGGGSNISGGGVQTSVVAFASSDQGTSFRFRGVIANASAWPDSFEGPNENSLVLLKDGKTLLSVIRVDGGDGCLPKTWPKLCAGPYSDYIKCTSQDAARTWQCESMVGIGAARP